MPTVSQDLTLVGGFNAEFITIPTERHIVYNITLQNLYPGNGTDSTFALIGVMSGGTKRQNKVATLASGYINKNTDLGWSGKLPTDPDQFLFGELYGPASIIIRLSHGST